jgi:hypothetical protein
LGIGRPPLAHHDRVGRKGEPCRWDGRILAAVVDRIHELGEFDETDWSTRSVVEITAAKKAHGWFFHAITGEAWLLKLKFRTSRDAVDGARLAAALDLKTLNQMDEIPRSTTTNRGCASRGRPPRVLELFGAGGGGVRQDRRSEGVQRRGSLAVEEARPGVARLAEGLSAGP